MEVRPYEPSDADDLWELKEGFERTIGSETGDDSKTALYEEKLTDEYRHRYLGWVARCIAADPRAVLVADDGESLAGYAFLLPDTMAMIWDAAVLNELYVVPDHRGTDVADDLLEAALDVARDQDLPLDRVVLDVDPSNERARAFYERYGFAGWGEMVARDL
jgi:ribosomal protein S18 acetylase RimI-like enzyme